jgi:hypothetical protein
MRWIGRIRHTSPFSRSPRFYGWCYLGLIPMFAIVYSTIGADFLQTTFDHEKQLTELASDAQLALDEYVTTWIEDVGPQAFQLPDNKTLLLGADEQGIHFITPFQWNTRPHERLNEGKVERVVISMWSYPRWNVQFPYGCKVISFGRWSRTMSTIRYLPNWVALDRQDWPQTLYWKHWRSMSGQMLHVTPASERESHEAEFVGEVSLLTPLCERVYRYYQAANGVASEQRMVPLRFLYFSVVTLTTLGYGDIVPVSDRARAIVGFEAVCGVILAGLFLNSLAAAHSRDERAH